MLLLVDGPDGAGKSTLISQLEELYPGLSTTHHGPYKGATGRELGAFLMSSMRPAFTNVMTVVDRSWLSEPIYAEVFRKQESRLDAALTRMLERSALTQGGVIVLCLPPFERCREAFMSGREEMMSSVDDLRRVYDRYALGPATSLPVVKHDYTSESVADLMAKVGAVLDNYPVPRITIIGDRPNVRTQAQQLYHVPFVTFSGRGCSEWLCEQLELSGVPEWGLDWYNAYDDQENPLDPELLEPGTIVVALGRHAQQWCFDNSIKHVHCPHPQVHKRFHYDKPYPLVNILKEIWNAKN